MAEYWLCYRVIDNNRDLGEFWQLLEASSDDQAYIKAMTRMQAFKNNAKPGIEYMFIRLTKKV